MKINTSTHKYFGGYLHPSMKETAGKKAKEDIMKDKKNLHISFPETERDG